jgi:hypothetical protein
VRAFALSRGTMDKLLLEKDLGPSENAEPTTAVTETPCFARVGSNAL